MGGNYFSLGLKRKIPAGGGDHVLKQTPAHIAAKLDGGLRLSKGVRAATKRNFVIVRTVKRWGRLPKELVQSPSLEALEGWAG